MNNGNGNAQQQPATATKKNKQHKQPTAFLDVRILWNNKQSHGLRSLFRHDKIEIHWKPEEYDNATRATWTSTTSEWQNKPNMAKPKKIQRCFGLLSLLLSLFLLLRLLLLWPLLFLYRSTIKRSMSSVSLPKKKYLQKERRKKTHRNFSDLFKLLMCACAPKITTPKLIE